jgi:branched-subunit amino acid aminotransferase/4-amino-4-deoxychorismate lyase
VHVISSELSRRQPRVKDTSFIGASAELRGLVGGGVFEVLLTRDGLILEGMTSNFYGIKGGTLITAGRGILPGVTRRAILRLARRLGMRVVYRAPLLGQDFDEAFLTSSSRGVVPVVSIDGNPVGEGRVGPWTKRLSQAYCSFIDERSENLISETP